MSAYLPVDVACGNCRFWAELEIDPPEDWQDHDYPTIDGNKPIEHGTRWGSCGAMNLVSSHDMGGPEKRLAYAQDASDYAASLRTQDVFGCAMWEARQ